MNKVFILPILFLALFSCKKSSTSHTYKVKYSVTGSAVNQYKITVNAEDKNVSTPFTGTRDTTLYVASSSNVKLDVKGSGTSTLVGSIYVNDALVATGSDADANGDNKTEVKLNYDLPQ